MATIVESPTATLRDGPKTTASVAASTQALRFPVPTPPPARPVVGSFNVVRLTTDQYDAMIESGILPTTLWVELIDGLLVRKDRSKTGADPMGVGQEHSWSVEQLSGLKPVLDQLGCVMRTQQPVVLGVGNEPEPDGSILRGSNADFRTRKPATADVLCVIEVADSSLAYDRREKLAIYAAAGVAQYVIVNLVDRVVEEYADPEGATYRSRTTFGIGQTFIFKLDAGRQLSVPVGEVIP